MQDELQKFFASPTADNFLMARRAVLREFADEFSPQRMQRLAALAEQERMAEAKLLFEEMLPAWALSPRIYWIGLRLADFYQDAEDQELFPFLHATCLEGLRNSGQGTRAAPFRPTYLTDIQDLLALLGKQPKQQRLVVNHGRFDVVSCQNGEEYWFKIPTACVPPPSRSETTRQTVSGPTR